MPLLPLLPHTCMRQGMLLREVQGEVLALEREKQASAGSTSSSHNRQRHQPPTSTLALTSSRGSTSSSPGSLLLLRQASSSPSGPHHDHMRKGYSLEKNGPEPARDGSGTIRDGSNTVRDHGSGTVPKTSETRAGTSKAPGARSGYRLSSSLLSLGWEVANDDDGNEFYYNGNTGESRWEPPPPDGAVDASPGLDDGDEEKILPEAGELGDDGGGSVEAEHVGDADSTPEDNDALRQPDALPVGWEAVAVENGAVYYHHVASGLTQWEVPHEGDGEETIGDTSALTALADEGAEWEEFQTEEGVPFWYNAATGESCWEPPGYPTE